MKGKNLSAIFAAAFVMTQGSAIAEDNTNFKTVETLEEITNNTIYYGTNVVNPKSDYMQTIHKYLNELKDNPSIFIRVSSHTDHIGSWESNLELSRKRAVAIAEYLRENGVPKDRIILNWLGEDAPMYYDRSKSHLNRRSHIRIIKKVQQQISTSPVVSNAASTKVEESVKPTPAPQPKVVQEVQTKPQPVIIEEKKEVKPAPAPVKEEVVESIPVSTPEPIVETQQEENISKNILFIDAVTQKPILVEVDLESNEGSLSFTSSNKGELNINPDSEETRKMDVYAYGYFHKTVEIPAGNFKQVIKLEPTKLGATIALDNLEFVSGKPKLKSKSKAELEKLVNMLTNNSTARIEIGGHINAPGVKPKKLGKKKFQLSEDRAKSVYNYLVKKGVSKDRLEYKGYGNSEMIFPKPEDEDQKAKNRRVEIKVI